MGPRYAAVPHLEHEGTVQHIHAVKAPRACRIAGVEQGASTEVRRGHVLLKDSGPLYTIDRLTHPSKNQVWESSNLV
jgi:hypothetical protein